MPNRVNKTSEMLHCRRCGSYLQRRNEGAIFSCKNDHIIFDNPRPAVGVILMQDTETIILGVRSRQPHAGAYDTVGGFVDIGETPEQALEREIHEELGLHSSHYTQPRYLCSATTLYPYKGEAIPVVSLFFVATLIAPDTPLHPGDDIGAVHIQPLADLSLDNFPQSDVRSAILYAKETLL